MADGFGIDLPSIYMAAMQVNEMQRRRQMEERAMLEQQAARQSALQREQAIRGAIASGDMNTLAQLSPELFFKFQEAQQSQAKNTREEEAAALSAEENRRKLFDARTQKTADTLLNTFKGLASTEDLPLALNSLAQQGQLRGLDQQMLGGVLQRIDGGDDLNSVMNDLRLASSTLKDPEATQVLKAYAEDLSAQVGRQVSTSEILSNKDWSSALPAYRKDYLERSTPKTINNAAPEDVKGLQEHLSSAESLLNNISDIRAEGDFSDLLGAFGKGKQFLLSSISKINPDALDKKQKDYLSRARRFKELVQQNFLQQRKLLTGTGGSEKEMDQIQDSMLNLDLGSEEFKASLDRLEMVTRRNASIADRILREGYKLGTSQFANRFRSEYNNAVAQEKQTAPRKTFTQAELDNMTIEQKRQALRAQQRGQ